MIELNLPQHELMGNHLKWRIYGFFSEPNWYSIFFSFGAIIFFQSRKSSNGLMKLVFSFHVLLSILISFSRGVILAMGATYLYFLKREYGMKRMFMAISFIAILAFTISSSAVLLGSSEAAYRFTSVDITKDPSSSQRLDVFVAIGSYINESSFLENLYGFFFGNGLGSFREILWFETPYNYFAMNIYVDLLFEYGLIPLLLLLIFLFRLTNFNHQENLKYHIYAVPLFLIIGLFYPIRNGIPYQIPFILSLALLIRSYYIKTEHQTSL